MKKSFVIEKKSSTSTNEVKDADSSTMDAERFIEQHGFALNDDLKDTTEGDALASSLAAIIKSIQGTH